MAIKRPLVLFSGGLDSTFLLYQHLLKKETVDYIYLQGGQSKNKIGCEKESRDRIVHWLNNQREEGSNVRFVDYDNYGFTAPVVNFGGAKGLSWCQPISWVVSALAAVDVDRHSHVEVGYVMGDEALQLVDQMKIAWNALWRMGKQGEPVPLEFPLRNTSKLKILHQMPAELYRLTWVCEDPKVTHLDGATPCGRCIPCETRLVEEYRYKLRNGRELSEDHQAILEKAQRQKELEEERTKKSAQEPSAASDVVIG